MVKRTHLTQEDRYAIEQMLRERKTLESIIQEIREDETMVAKEIKGTQAINQRIDLSTLHINLIYEYVMSNAAHPHSRVMSSLSSCAFTSFDILKIHHGSDILQRTVF